MLSRMEVVKAVKWHIQELLQVDCNYPEVIFFSLLHVQLEESNSLKVTTSAARYDQVGRG